MAIQNRRGSYTNFDPSKLKPGEWAIVQSNDPATTDGKTVYIAFAAGDVKRMATFEDMENFLYNMIDEIIQEIESEVAEDVERAETAAESAEASAERAEQLYQVTDPNNDGNLVIRIGNGGS